jgi:hypothetical protein
MIDGGIATDWPPKVVAAVAKFDQGDLVEAPPFFYAGVPGKAVWYATAAFAQEDDADECIVVDLDPQDRSPYGILTSQGCDVVDVARKPWVQVAPVFDAREDPRLPEIRREAIPHLVLLDPPTLDGVWVADLRLEMPIEKSWLVGRNPIPGFRDDDARTNFGRHLGARLQRPALPDEVHDVVVRPLRRWLQRLGTGVRSALAESAVEFRLSFRSSPDGRHKCRLLAIARRGPFPADLAERLDQWWSEVGASMSSDLVLLGCRCGTVDEFTMRDYLASVLLDERFVDLTDVA